MKAFYIFISISLFTLSTICYSNEEQEPLRKMIGNYHKPMQTYHNQNSVNQLFAMQELCKEIQTYREKNSTFPENLKTFISKISSNSPKADLSKIIYVKPENSTITDKGIACDTYGNIIFDAGYVSTFNGKNWLSYSNNKKLIEAYNKAL